MLSPVMWIINEVSMVRWAFAVLAYVGLGMASDFDARAEAVSLFLDHNKDERRALFSVRHDVDAHQEGAAKGQSLFVGTQGASLFAPLDAPASAPLALRHMASQIERIRDLIGSAESRKHGYDAVQHGARIRPRKTPTDMTLAEIYHWIDATPGQPHAIGRFQFIPVTLRRLVTHLGVSLNARFTPQLQDQLADVLLIEAGLTQFNAGAINRTQFMNNLAKIWAGLPNSTGRSHYHGYAGNKASMTWAHFNAEMQKIFPG